MGDWLLVILKVFILTSWTFTILLNPFAIFISSLETQKMYRKKERETTNHSMAFNAIFHFTLHTFTATVACQNKKARVNFTHTHVLSIKSFALPKIVGRDFSPFLWLLLMSIWMILIWFRWACNLGEITSRFYGNENRKKNRWNLMSHLRNCEYQ